MQPVVSSLSAGDCPVHRLRKKLTGTQDSHLQTVTIPEAAYIQLRRNILLQTVTMPEVAYIQLRRRPPEDEQVNVRNM